MVDFEKIIKEKYPYFDMRKYSGLSKLNILFFLETKNNDINYKNLLNYEGLYYNIGLKNACLNNNIYMTELMISYGAYNLNHCLIIACENKNIELVKLLIKHGARNITQALHKVEDNDIYNKNKLYEIIYYLLPIANENPFRILKKHYDITLYKKCLKLGMKVYDYKNKQIIKNQCNVFLLYKSSFNPNNKYLYKLPVEIYRIINEYV